MAENPQLEILLPTPAVSGDATSDTFDLGRPIAGVAVGLRLDRSWRSYFAVIDEWEQLLQRAGATVHVLWAGDRSGPAGEQTRTDVDDWSRLVECGVVGLGN